jgi:hypothetical protein
MKSNKLVFPKSSFRVIFNYLKRKLDMEISDEELGDYLEEVFDFIPDHTKKTYRNHYRNLVVHRSLNGLALCGSFILECVTTELDEMVTCKNCLSPKNQRKLLAKKDSENKDEEIGENNPEKKLPIVPHFLP